MKTVYVLMALMLLTIGIVSASTAPVVDCGSNKWYDWDAGDCKANEVQPAVDELHDNQVKGDKKLNRKINKVSNTIEDNSPAWLRGDGDGIKWSRVSDYLLGGYWAKIMDNFATKDDLALSEARIMVELTGEGSVNCRAAMIRAQQTGEDYTIGDRIATPGNRLFCNTV